MIAAAIGWAAEVVRANGTGVNAQLAHVPSEPGEAPAPPVRILDENTCDWLASGPIPREQLLDELKAPEQILIVRLVRDEHGIPVQMVPERINTNPIIVPIEIACLSRRVEVLGVEYSIAEQKLIARQTMRTVSRVFAQKFESTLTTYTRGGVEIRLPDTALVLMPEPEDLTDVVYEGGVLSLLVFDRWAVGIGP